MLTIKGVTLIRDSKEILHKIDLQVGEGCIHSIMGPNGSGKSSLAYTIMGCSGYSPACGSIEFNGRDLTSAGICQRAAAGITLAWQEPARFEGLTVRDYLSIGTRGKIHLNELEQALALVNMSPKRYLDREVGESLSGGERKRIELASVVTAHPRLAILDEPDSGIDVISIRDIINLIYRLKDNGASVLVITHRPEIVETGDSASLICEGRITMTGTPLEVSDYYQQRCAPCPREMERGSIL